MSEAPSYEIRTVADFLKVPADRRAACLAEFPRFLDYAEAIAGFTDAYGAPANVEAYIWTDDGVERITSASFTAKGEEVLRMEFTYQGEPDPSSASSDGRTPS